MDLHKAFINEYGRLRSGWRLLFFVVAFIAISFLLATGLRIAYAILQPILPAVPHAAFLADVIFRFSFLASALLAGYLCTRLFEGLPWRALGLTFHAGWLRDLLIGSVVGLLSLALAVSIATAAGGLRFTTSGREMILSVGRSLISSACLFIIVALSEAAMVRGYPLQTPARAQLACLRALLTSVSLAAVHLLSLYHILLVTIAH